MAQAIGIPAIPQVPTVAELETRPGKELLIDWMLAVKEILELRENHRGIEPPERSVIRRELDGYESEELTITNAATLTLRHELFLGSGVDSIATEPRHVKAFLVCALDNAGYKPGDKVQIATEAQPTSSTGMTVLVGPEKISVVIGSGGLLVNNKSTGVGTVITNANWRLVIKAWA